MPEAGGLDTADLILLLLHAYASSARGRALPEIHGSTRLQKLLFLAVRERPKEPRLRELGKALGFVPYHYGPFSKRVEDSVGLLERLSLVRVRRFGQGSLMERLEQWEATHPFEFSDQSQVAYSLTEDGRQVADRLRVTAGERLWRYLGRLVNEFGAIRLGELILFVYEKYPEMVPQPQLKQQS